MHARGTSHRRLPGAIGAAYVRAMSTKLQRQTAILRLVRSQRIPSQERLRELLGAAGFQVTQATLSRDLRSLGVVKVADSGGHTYYAVPADVVDPTPALAQLLPALYVGAEGVGTLLVVKTLAGGASPLASAMDHQEWDEVAGTIAGDDTILVITRSSSARQRLQRRIEGLVD
jgi:transcriptional regulator of arginine metabolism